jgi:hypothetical protein
MLNKISFGSFRYHSTTITHFLFLRSLGFIYCVAFLVFLNQWEALLGSQGLSPASHFLHSMSNQKSFWDLPSIFWFNSSDSFLFWSGCIGFIISILVSLGLTNAIAMFLLWAIYMSIIHVGQQFYSFGWETMLLETGFLAIFLCPVFSWKPFSKNTPPSPAIFILILWLLFRNMFGAGLIKLRGDDVWKDLTALTYHFETQPIPNSFSWFFHHLPLPILKLGVLINHVVELIVPFFLFGPRLFRHSAAFIILIFQMTLILSGNLSWLNWLTIVQCIPAFDDQRFYFFKKLSFFNTFSIYRYTNINLISHIILYIVISCLSVSPIKNLVNPKQKMNASFNSLHLVNTYGAFGSVGKVRYQLVFFGTTDSIISEQTQWIPYQFKGQPSILNQIPPFFSPYHYRLDWQLWFAAMSDYRYHPWLVHFIYKLLHNDPKTLSLIKANPFLKRPPTFIKVDRYHYEFTESISQGWWKRSFLNTYLPPLSKDNSSLIKFVNQLK